jgi:hypothetical protein
MTFVLQSANIGRALFLILYILLEGDGLVGQLQPIWHSHSSVTEEFGLNDTVVKVNACHPVPSFVTPFDTAPEKYSYKLFFIPRYEF